MKFRLKITICMIWLLTLAFGIGGSMLIALNFSNAFEREKATALSSHQMLLSALQIVDEAGADPEHKELASTLEQLNGQEWTGFAMLSLCGPDGEIIYFSGERSINTIVQLAPDDGMSRMTVIRGDDGGRYIRLTSAFKSGQDTLILDQCSSVSDVYTARGEQLRIYRRVFAAVVVLGGGLSWLLAYWLTRPLTALSRASRRFAAGDLEYREAVRSTDELGTLTADFNVMADKLAANIHELQDAAARQESFMGSFAHEMKNPMTSIIGYAELIRSQMLTPEEEQDAANYIFSEGKRLESLSFKLLDILVLKKKTAELQPCSPAQLVGGTVEHLRRVYAEKNIVLQCRCEEGMCMLEPDLVKSLLVNLLDNARKESFMGSFAHEMKNPMTSIIGYAELIRSQMLTPEEEQDAANYIFSEGKRLESLSFKLLDILVLKKKTAELQPCSPAQLVGGTVEHLRRVYAEKNIVLQCRCEEGMCMLEPDLVKSLLVNLLDNARKAMDGGGNIYVVSEMLPDGCRIRVLDTGRGIPQEEITHITEAFYRVDKSRSRAQGGVGLGLSLCSEIVQLHNGTMSFASRVGNGTCVTVELKGGAV